MDQALESALAQDENGTDLWLLRRNLERSVEERFVLLEQQLEFAAELQRAARVSHELSPRPECP
jgi:hypothetical protein